tara:strand:- start:401 stop:811 length:411 start_codon:yes stop_codon:yes gene_type:complete
VKRTVLIFGSLILALLLLFLISKYAIISGTLEVENALGIVALVFLLAGIFLYKGSKTGLPPPVDFIDHKKIKALELSKREYEVLKEISIGLSNREIADKLFLTESTIKTHVSNVLVKLNAKRRTQAVRIAKSLQII